MTTEISVSEKAAKYRRLAANPPCMNCEMKRSEHANGKCLFSPGVFVEPSHAYLRIFFRWGTFKHEGRVRHNRGGP